MLIKVYAASINSGDWDLLFQLMVLGPLMSTFGNQKLGLLMHRPNPADLELANELIEAGQMAPVIERRYPLREVAQALRYFGQGQFVGKVVIAMERASGATAAD